MNRFLSRCTPAQLRSLAEALDVVVDAKSRGGAGVGGAGTGGGGNESGN